jgi:D-glycero-D-manno-heptose 1,7-bisphosphate phosphatase
MNKAVFLDRDGVINPLVYNPKTSEYESPHYPEDFSVYPTVLKALKKLKGQGYYIFVVSNQPSYAKGKTSLENIRAIEQLFSDYIDENGASVDRYYYCYHHPDGTVPEFAVKCRCRKPGTAFPEDAVERYMLDVGLCWFVGDRDTDIECGKDLGMRTILIKNKHSKDKAGKVAPTVSASDIGEAALIILESE